VSTWIKLSARFKTFLKTMADGVCGHEWKMEVEVFSLESLLYSIRMCEVWL